MVSGWSRTPLCSTGGLTTAVVPVFWTVPAITLRRRAESATSDRRLVTVATIRLCCRSRTADRGIEAWLFATLPSHVLSARGLDRRPVWGTLSAEVDAVAVAPVPPAFSLSCRYTSPSCRYARLPPVLITGRCHCAFPFMIPPSALITADWSPARSPAIIA